MTCWGHPADEVSQPPPRPLFAHRPLFVLPQGGAITGGFSLTCHTATNCTSLNSESGRLCAASKVEVEETAVHPRGLRGAGRGGAGQPGRAELPNSAAPMANPQGLSVELDILLDVNN